MILSKWVELVQKVTSTGGFLARYGNNRFKEEYCDLIIKMFEEGKSLAHFCTEVGCHRGTVYNWADRYPKTFGEAYKYAREAGFAAHLDKADTGMFFENFNTELFKYVFSKRFSRMANEQNLNGLYKQPKGKGKSKELNPVDEIMNIQELYKSGEIDMDEAGKLIKQVSDKHGIKTEADLQARLERLEGIVEEAECEED